MAIEPMYGKFLIKRCEPESKSGGIIIPETAKDKPTKGEVLAVGKSKKDEQHDVKVGDVVIFKQWGGTEIRDEKGDQTLIMVSLDDILGIER